MGGSDIQSYAWAGRITTDDEFKFEEMEALSGWTFMAYVVEKGTQSGKRHYHVNVVYPTTLTKNKIDYKFKKAMPELVGNGKKSVIPWKTFDDLESDTLLQYMHKENRPKFFGQLMGVQTHEEYERRCQVYRDQLKKRKAKKEEIVDHCISKIQEWEKGYGRLVRDHVFFDEQRRAIAKIYLMFCREHSIRYVENNVRNTISFIMLRVSEGDAYEQEYLDYLIDRIAR